MTKRTDAYVRIMRAAEKGKGVVLSADEVWLMHLDDAIATHAAFLQYGPIDEKTGKRPGQPERTK